RFIQTASCNQHSDLRVFADNLLSPSPRLAQLLFGRTATSVRLTISCKQRLRASNRHQRTPITDNQPIQAAQYRSSACSQLTAPPSPLRRHRRQARMPTVWPPRVQNQEKYK